MGTRRALFGLFVVLLVALPATVAFGDPGETKVLDLRTKSQPGSRTIVFCRAEGPVDHAVVVLGRMAPGAQAPEILALGLVPRTDPLGVPTAYVGPVERELVENLLQGKLPLPTHRLVCQVDSEVFRAAMEVHERWRAKSDHGLTTGDCVVLLREIATTAGLRVKGGTETAPGRVITALLADNDPDAVPVTPAPADPAGPADPIVPTDPGRRPDPILPTDPARPADPVAPTDGVTLPRVGTLGALPPAADTIVVDVTGDGRILVDGEGPLSLVALEESLRRRTADPNWREADQSSRKHLLVRADAAVPWTVPVWILMIAATPNVRIYKIHFGAAPREGAGAGAIGCELPKDRGLAPTLGFAEESSVVTALIWKSSRPESDPEGLFPVLAQLRAAAGEGARLEIKTPPPKGLFVSTGFVVRVMDVAMRAGFRRLVLEGHPPPTPEEAASVEFLRSYVAGRKRGPGTHTVKVGGVFIGQLPSGAAVPPARGLLPTLYGFGGAAGDVIRDEEIEDHIETDGDLPFEESFGEDGIGDAPFSGPRDNGVIGIGGGAGGAFRGRGGKRLAAPADTVRAQRAVEDALKWLAAHQSPDGGWEAAGFSKWCDGRPARQGPDGVGKAVYDPGITGLALCAYLGAGYTNRGRHPYAKVVSKAARYLKNVQDDEGCIGPRSNQNFIYSHAVAALALVEIYGMTGSPIFKGSAQRALDFIATCRNPYFAWRYGVKPGDNDTSVTGWMASVLESARAVNADATKRGKPAPLMIDDTAFDGIRAWLQKMTDPDYGRVGYIQRGGSPARPQELIDRFPADRSEAMTAVGVFTRLRLGDGASDRAILDKGAALMARLPPTWNPGSGDIDMYYWYYGSLAMFQVGGPRWDAWRAKLFTALLDHQRQDTEPCMFKGSWDPIGPWGPDGGRVYSTALLALCLQTPYRYARSTSR